jgi:hypothetical protein
MSSEYRALGTIINLPSALDISLTVVLTGTGTATLNSSDSAYLTMAAGKYRLPDFLQILASKISDWLFAAATADASVTTKPTLANCDCSFTFTPSLTQNGSRVAMSLTITGAQVGGTAATVTSVALTNLNGLWTIIGFDSEPSSPFSMSVAAGVATYTGRFQPRSIFVFLRSEIDFGNTEEVIQYKALKFADSTGSSFYSGRALTRRALRLVDQDQDIGGRDMPLARLDSINASRNILQASNTTAVSYVTGFEANQINDDAVNDTWTDGAYVEIPGQWVGRLQTSDETAIPATIVLWEYVPSSITPPTKAPLMRISEVKALWFEAMRLGYLCVYDVNETPGADFGKIVWTGEEYMLAEESRLWDADRRDAGAALYSYTFNLIRRDGNDLVFAS